MSKRVVLMKHCLDEGRVNMDTSEDTSALYFYLHLLIVYDLGVMVPFTSLKIEFLIVVNVAPS